MRKPTNFTVAAGERYVWGRLVDAPPAGGYLVLQWPLTRAPETTAVSASDYYQMLSVVCRSVITCTTDAAAREYTPEDIARRIEWHKDHPPLGFEQPRWRWQWPVRRVGSDEKLISIGDYAQQETALWEAASAALKIPDPPWAEAVDLYWETMLASYQRDLAQESEAGEMAERVRDGLRAIGEPDRTTR